MNKIQKAMERSKALRESSAAVAELSEREQLEIDIKKLLSDEFPEIVGSMKKKIRLSYSKTKTIPADPQTLYRNRLFTIVKDIEITNKFEILKAQVLKKLKQMKANSLMITSANPREGKTFISTNLAVSIAQNLDRTVMLVDADLGNRSNQHQSAANVFFNSNSRSGLSDYLSGSGNLEDLLINPGIPRLTILPSGRMNLNSTALLSSPKMEELINDMKSRYSTERVIIFDCSSCLSNANALVLARYVDSVLLVVENQKTEGKDLKRMIELLKDKSIVGTVMNKSRNFS
jgi:protein-tyrosine kinase